MRRKEEKFASREVKDVAIRTGSAIRSARLSRNMTQGAAAERAKMSHATWFKIEKGEVSPSAGAWLSAMECVGLLGLFDTLGPAGAAAPAKRNRVRARPSAAAVEKYDF